AGALLDRSHAWMTELRRQGLSAGDVCAIVGDFGGESVSIMLALMRLGAIAMPLSDSTFHLGQLLALAGERWVIRYQTDASFLVETIAGLPQNDLILQFQAIQHPGLIVFTSGSSGEPKGILHDFERVLGKFSIARRGWRTILFLTIDHF